LNKARNIDDLTDSTANTHPRKGRLHNSQIIENGRQLMTEIKYGEITSSKVGLKRGDNYKV